MNGNGLKPPDSADKNLGDIVGEVSEKASLLVREEIELAKAEVQAKMSKLIKGAVVGGVAGVFALFGLIYLLHTLAWFLDDLLNSDVWVGFGIVTAALFIFGAIAALLAYRWIKRGVPPTPDLAIEEAKRTRVAIDEARH